jgi:hypothetical protein
LIILGVIGLVMYVFGLTTTCSGSSSSSTSTTSTDRGNNNENIYSLTAREQQRVRTYVREINRAQEDYNRYHKK